MTRQVKGILFVEYVKIIRSAKQIRWEKYLDEESLAYTRKQILESNWYPMETFEKLGLAILSALVSDDLDRVREWGTQSIDHLRLTEPYLIAAGDPLETFMRFRILRQALIDYPAVSVRTVVDGRVILDIDYGMSDRAEEAAAHQTLGFLSRLLEISGGREVETRLIARRWEGDPKTSIQATWRT